ncbi:MAG: hypothetical protein GY822_14045 [Deltaproteobacteria bacterium]|nr:hypothetical protein [Deltaproteobacteria bacterium]
MTLLKTSFMKGMQSQHLLFVLFAFSFLGAATETLAYQPYVVGVHARDELPWLQATATIKNPKLPIAHLVTMALLLEKEVSHPSSPLPATLERLMAGGASYKVNAWPEGLVIQVSGPASLVDEWRIHHPSSLLPSLPFPLSEAGPVRSSSPSYSAAQVCEQARSRTTLSSSSGLWGAFFQDIPQANLDEASCWGITFSSLREARKRLLKVRWHWLLEGRLSAAQGLVVEDPKKASKDSPKTKSTWTHAFPPEAAAQDSTFSAVAQLFDARNVSPAALRALVRFLAQECDAEVHVEHRLGITLLIFRSTQARSSTFWKAKIARAQVALNETSFRYFLDEENAREVFLLASVGAWSARNARFLLLGFPVETRKSLSAKHLQGLLFPSAIRGEPLAVQGR